ncbi:MAG: NAD(P)/FAD-dependent oxidoreductase [Phycisphaerae bacterium]
MRIAVIGSGISGLACGYLLAGSQDVTVFEASARAGGHTRSFQVRRPEGNWAVDTGFVVFNRRTYPNFCLLLERLSVASQPSNMSFSLRNEKSGLEFCPSSLDRLFAQRRNLFRPRFWSMVRDLLRFRRETRHMLDESAEDRTLEAYLQRGGYGRAFAEEFIMPMGASIWSADPQRFGQFPVRYMVEFFANHGFLERQQPQWLTVSGGASRYVEKILDSIGDRVRLGCPVRSVRRKGGQVELQTDSGSEMFDEVIFAVHSDQALSMLADPDDAEREILGQIPYQPNHVVLHTDATIMPQRRKVWASWNYLIPASPIGRVAITYDMNILQSLDAPVEFLVTLNQSERIDPEKVILEFETGHPVYTPDSLAARRRWEDISGRDGRHYCGAYWGFGFHEDGLASALRVCERFGVSL